jgi:hypothetical protein
LVLAVAVGVVGNHIDRQVSAGYTSYWEKVHDSLRNALASAPITLSVGFPTCQLTRFNSTHTLIHDPDGRQDAVASIMAEQVFTRTRRCPGHGGGRTGVSLDKARRGRPASWAAVSIIIIGFIVGGIAMIVGLAWWFFWTGAGIVVIGGIFALSVGIFDDWY